MIAVRCPECAARFQAPDKFAGRRAKCPRCKGTFVVPAEDSSAASPETPASPPSKIDQRQQILEALGGTITRGNATIFYRLSALLVAIVMVLLPLLYIVLIGVVIYGVYYHAVNHTGIMNGARGRGALLVFLVYIAPIVVGAILIFFMIKPLFAPPADEQRRRNLTPRGEPLLFAVVERLCQIVGAPMPKRIDVNCEINASASFRRGLLSVVTGSDLVLTIGIPLVEGLTMRQLIGVLAHEFGHFTQGGGMRLTYVIRSINHWFLRVVYQRDAWDQWLAESAAGIDLRIGWILYLSMLCVWLSRGVLWVFMVVGHAVSGIMLRQMEFDADLYEIRVAGSKAFETTARRLAELGVAYQGAMHDLVTHINGGNLPDDIPGLIAQNAIQLPPDVIHKIHQSIDETKTGLFDTHPSDRQRIAASRAENAPGIVNIDLPASILFSQYEALSRNVTWDMYCEILGPGIKPTDMKPLAELT